MMIQKVQCRDLFLSVSAAIMAFTLGVHTSGCGKPCPLVPEEEPKAPAMPVCANEKLMSFSELLVIVPHPGDEILGFAGLINAYASAGKKVTVAVVTNGEGHCEACGFWKNGRGGTPLCSEAELEEFAKLRRKETADALKLIGGPEPVFLDFPDDTVLEAWNGLLTEKGEVRLRRSDFSKCWSCSGCLNGRGSRSLHTTRELFREVSRLLLETSDGALVATSHQLDGHSDHSALARFVEASNRLAKPERTVARAVIRGRPSSWVMHHDCAFPAPAVDACGCRQISDRCYENNVRLLERMRSYRYRPEWPMETPPDREYGSALSFCLPEKMYRGPGALKKLAVESFGTQIGTVARKDAIMGHLKGWVDCNGFMNGFIRSTEVLLLGE